MSIASEFDSTIENIKSDYEGLENLGADLTNVNKNIQNIRTCLDNIYSSLPKTTGEGSNLSLTTLKGRINVDDILGDTEQDGTPTPSTPINIEVVTGQQEVVVQNKNIYDSSYRTPNNTILCAGGTCTEENGVFTIQCNRNDMYVWNVENGGSTHSAYQNQLIDFIENTYTITITNALFTKNFVTFFDADKKVLNFKQFNSNIFTFTKGQDSSVPSTAKYFSLRFGINDSVSGTTYTTSVQIETGSTATSYVEHAEQTQIVELSSKNLFNGNWTNGIRLNATTGAEESNANSSVSGYIPVDFIKNTNYYLSGLLNTMHSTIWAYNSNKQGLHRTANELRTAIGLTSSSFIGGTAQGTGDIAYIRINMRIESGDTGSLSDLTNANVQLEKGSSATTYEQYYNIELCKIGTYQDRIFETSGKNLFNKDDTSLIFNGFPNASTGLLQANDNARTICLPCQPNTTYTISKIISARFLGGETSSDTISAGISVTTTSSYASLTHFTYTTSASAKYLLVFYYLSTADTLSEETIRNSIMINLGSTALPYEPYGSDKWYIEKKMGKTLLKDVPQGTNNWTKSNAYSTNDYFCGFCGFASIKINSYYILCNKLINAIYSDTTTSECIANDSESVNLKIKASRLSENSPTGLANYLANEGSDIYIIYILKTPTYTEITNTTLLNELNELEKMMSYSGQTNISISGNLPMILDVSALKGE